MEDCIFCKIVSADGDNIIWQNEVAVAVKDLHPKAPVHVLVLSKQHISSLDELDDPELAGKLLMAAREVAAKVGVTGGWRLQVNSGASAGQTIAHLHLHVVGGKKLAE